MREDSWIRVSGMAGIASVVVWWVGAAIDAALGDPDPALAGVADITAFMDGHATSGPARLAFAFSAFLVIWFVAGLQARMRRAGADPVLVTSAVGGGFVAAALMLAGNAGWLAASFPAVRDGGPDSTVLAYALQLAPGLTASVGFAALLLAVGVASIARRALPRWLGVSAVVIAVVELAGYLDPLDGPLAGALMLRMLWFVVAGVVLVVRPALPGIGRAATGAEATVP